MKTNSNLRLLVVSGALGYSQAYTWPDSQIDVVEGAMYESATGIGNALRSFVAPCGTSIVPPSGGTDAADWLRTAYHDMATADAAAGTGGIDASIAWETLRNENKGNAFNNTIQVFRQFQSVRLSMADIIALGARIAVQSCSGGKVVIPMKAGRVDATGPGPSGVPEPQQSLDDHTKSFERQGFNVTDMIAMVACGHAIGGVHGLDFPDIVANKPTSNNTESVQAFDDTQSVYDNHILYGIQFVSNCIMLDSSATGFVSNSTQNALAFGPNETTRSDFRIFTHPKDGGGNLIRQMASSEEFFFSTCQDILTRMLDVVPRNVKLTETIPVIRIKPTISSMFVNENDSTMKIIGSIRVLEDGSSSRNRKVSIHALPRDPRSCNKTAACGPSQENLPQAFTQDAASGYPGFTWYRLNLTVPMAEGISSFSVQIDEDGKSSTEDNGGNGFPINDIIFPIIVPPRMGPPASCVRGDNTGSISNTTLNLLTAVRDDLIDAATLELIGQSPVPDGAPVQRFESIRAPMVKWRTNWANTGYSVYNATVSATWDFGAFAGRGDRTFDVVAQSKDGTKVESTFWSWDDLQLCP